MLLVREYKRIKKSSYMIAAALIVLLVGIFMSLLISNDIRLGISIFGELTTFKNGDSILLNGANYSKGLGLIFAIIINLSIGKEHQYKTWQHLTSHNIKRNDIYFAKLITSMIIAIGLFWIYELVSYVIITISGFPVMSLVEFLKLIFGGAIVYAILASLICFISMIAKNHISSLITSIAFVLLESPFIRLVGNISEIVGFSKIYSYLVKYSLYGINELIQTQIDYVPIIFISLCFWLILTVMVGKTIFNKIEL